ATATSGYALYALDATGTWRDPIVPIQVAGGIGTFLLPSFSAHAIVGPIPSTHYFVLEAEGAVHYINGGAAGFLHRGQFIPLVGNVRTERGSYALLGTNGGERIRILPDTTVDLGGVDGFDNDRFRLHHGRLYIVENIVRTHDNSACIWVRTDEAT